jgi:nucleotide-binding universal stress UspA family protein
MSEVILVLLRHPEFAPDLLRAAGRLAEMMGHARVHALAVREAIEMRPVVDGALIDTPGALMKAEAQERRRVETLRAIFDDWAGNARESATGADWFEADGASATIVAERGSRADVIVEAQPAEDDTVARQAFRAALFGTDRPVLMIPPNARTGFGTRVAIAWRDEKRTVRAVIPVLRWLASAEQVHVLVGVREAAAQPRLPAILQEHGIAASLHVLPIGPAPFGHTLLQKSRELGADLLVMGAYIHSPLRGLILGGVTQYMLNYADLPVLMRH